MGRERKEVRALFWRLWLVGLVWLWLAGRSMSFDMQRKGNEREELLLHSHSHSHSDSHLNYVSKRRVPNGPDPIHNRRTVKSRRPSTRA